MILTGGMIFSRMIIDPHTPRGTFGGLSYGEGVAGYDIRLARRVVLPPGRTVLGVSLERFNVPCDVLGRVCDKSTWIREGVRVGNSVIEPGWRGHLTLELVWHPLAISAADFSGGMVICAGMPIAQVIFEQIAASTCGYAGKYQDQPCEAVSAIFDDAQ